MTRTYPALRSTVIFVVAFSAIWIGLILLVSLSEPPNSLVALPIALVPIGYLFTVTQVTLADDGNCEFRSAVRRRHIRAQRITKISADEGVIEVDHDRGKIQMWETVDFDGLLSRLLQLNPAIELMGLDRPRLDATRPQYRTGGHRSE